MSRTHRSSSALPGLVATLFVSFALTGCGDDGNPAGTGGTGNAGSGGGGAGAGGAGGAPFEPCYPTTVDAAELCNPDKVGFSLNSTNQYYPLVVGSVAILEGMEDGQLYRIERRVLDETQDVAGVTTRVLEAKEFIDDELYEIARNFYVEADNGVVCYFGEDVEFYENGMLANTDGTWRVGVDGGEPGVIMPAMPKVGDAYFQELAPGIAMDMGRVTEIGGMETFGADTYMDVITIMDGNPLESCEDEEPKLYVPGIGEAADTSKRLISFTPGPAM